MDISFNKTKKFPNVGGYAPLTPRFCLEFEINNHFNGGTFHSFIFYFLHFLSFQQNEL